MAHVIVDQVLQTTKPSDIEDGAWINVVGYIIDGPRTAGERAVSDERKARSRRRKGSAVYVQALMLWSAGTINLGAYERALELRQSV